MKYYGIDGLGINSEFRSNAATMASLREFVAACRREAEAADWHFELCWYDGTDDKGTIQFDMGLSTHNAKMFGTEAERVSDMLFFNYNWSAQSLRRSADKARAMGRSPTSGFKS